MHIHGAEKYLKPTIICYNMTTETLQIMDELKLIKEELGYIKDHMVDKDMFLD